MTLYDKTINIQTPPSLIWSRARDFSRERQVTYQTAYRWLVITEAELSYVHLFQRQPDGSTHLRLMVESASEIRQALGPNLDPSALEALADTPQQTTYAPPGIHFDPLAAEERLNHIKNEAESAAQSFHRGRKRIVTSPASMPNLLITPILVALNLSIFVLMLLSGVSLMEPEIRQLLDWGANYGPYTIGGEWWRMLSATFLHIGIIHLLFNMQCLLRLGNIAERMFGNWTFLMLYVLSGLGGSIASLWWNPMTVSAGASGAIFGIAGGLVAFLYLGKQSAPRAAINRGLSSILLFVGYNLVFGFVVPGIDNAAHLGGLVTGFIVGASFIRPLPLLKIHSRLGNFVAILGVALILVLGAGLVEKPTASVAPDRRVMNHFNQGVDYQEQGRLDLAIEEYTQAIELEPQLAEAYVNRGIAHAMLGRYLQALADFDTAIESYPDGANLYFLRGAVHAEMGQRESAIADMEKALELGLDPDMEQDAASILERLSP